MLVLALLATVSGTSAPAKSDGAACGDEQAPVTRLSHGSRYAGDGPARADIDREAHAAVEAALAPIDATIEAVARAANGARTADDVACVVTTLHLWADADALSDLRSVNAQLSAPARIGGFALAYLQIAPAARDDHPGRARRIEQWLASRARASARWFETEAPPRSRRNNLRAWAGLAAAAAGRAVDDPDLTEWAAGTVRLVACAADADGALPHEMARGKRALQYQLHALAPLVTTAALLEAEGRDLFAACEGALHRAVAFVPRAFAEPDLVRGKAGAAQMLLTGADRLAPHDLAWTEIYLARFEAAPLRALAVPFDRPAHSKLGGTQDGLW
jgi:poly(beta-D-mannuronate) lyase